MNSKKNSILAALELGVKPAPRKFKVARNTLRSWVKKFKLQGNSGLKDQRQGPKHIPHKISAEEEERIISIRKRVPCFGPVRIKYFYDIKCSLWDVF